MYLDTTYFAEDWKLITENNLWVTIYGWKHCSFALMHYSYLMNSARDAGPKKGQKCRHDPNGALVNVWIASMSSLSPLFLFSFLEKSVFMWFVLFSGSHVLFTRPQTSFFNKIFIKNGSDGTIHTFKNYFATVFSVFSKIRGIQIDT